MTRWDRFSRTADRIAWALIWVSVLLLYAWIALWILSGIMTLLGVRVR